MEIEKQKTGAIFISFEDKKEVGKVWYIIEKDRIRRLGIGHGIIFKHIPKIIWGCMIGIFKRREK